MRQDWLQVAVDDLAAVDVQGLEEAAVHQTPQPSVGPAVCLGRVGHQLDGQRDVLLHDCQVCPQSLHHVLGRDAFPSDPFLLFVEQFRPDAVGVERFQQLLLLGAQGGQRALGVLGVRRAAVAEGIQATEQLTTQRLSLVG